MQEVKQGEKEKHRNQLISFMIGIPNLILLAFTAKAAANKPSTTVIDNINVQVSAKATINCSYISERNSNIK